MSQRTVAVIQARLSSSRLPGKVLAEIGGMPAIRFMAERVRRARRIDHILVATSADPSDDALAAALDAAGIDHVRGSLDDVLARFQLAAEHSDADRLVRLTGDCPLIDPDLIDRVVEALDGADYASNTDPPSFPDGLDVEAFTRAALDRALAEAAAGAEREHVTLWMRGDGSGLRRANVAAPEDWSGLRWTVDYPDDLERIRAIVAALGASAIDAGLAEMLRAFDTLDVIERAPNHSRNEGLAKSLREDARARPDATKGGIVDPIGAYGSLAKLDIAPTVLAGRYPFQAEAERRILDDVRPKLQLAPHHRLLDIGCGAGALLVPLSYQVAEAVGIDHETIVTALDRRHKLDNVALLAGAFPDVRPEGLFDRIVSYSVMFYLPDLPGAIDFALKAAALLRPGGRMLLADMPNRDRQRRWRKSDAGKAAEVEWGDLKARMESNIGVDQLSRDLAGATLIGGFTDADLAQLLLALRSAGFEAYLMPQSPDLPFGRTREDILVERV